MGEILRLSLSLYFLYLFYLLCFCGITKVRVVVSLFGSRATGNTQEKLWRVWFFRFYLCRSLFPQIFLFSFPLIMPSFFVLSRHALPFVFTPLSRNEDTSNWKKRNERIHSSESPLYLYELLYMSSVSHNLLWAGIRSLSSLHSFNPQKIADHVCQFWLL